VQKTELIYTFLCKSLAQAKISWYLWFAILELYRQNIILWVRFEPILIEASANTIRYK